MKTIKKYANAISATFLVGSLVGCAATQTVIEHGKLVTNTQQSKTIFLEPVASNQKTIFVSVKNNSEESIHFELALRERLKHKGYKISKSPGDAHYILQANVLQVGKMSAAASQSALGGGFGSAIAGAAAGTAIGALASQSSTGMVAGGLSGGVIGLAADALVKDVSYTMVTDVLITEHQPKDLKKYRTRIISSANQVNLKFNNAKPFLEAGLVKAIAGIF
jgi:hypothetical protein